MAAVKWIKIVTDIFDDEKILLIEALPEADSIIVIWFKLLCLAGKQNNKGVFLMSDRVAYTDEMLATIFRRPLNTIRLALATFEKYGMVEIVNNVITIPNWEKHQALDAYERKKQMDRERIAKKRADQKLVAEMSQNVGDSRALEEDKEEDREEDKKENNILSDSYESDRTAASPADAVMSAWNSMAECFPDVKPVKSISGKRKDHLNARIRECGVAGVTDAIGRIYRSDFLQGKGTRGWTVTFDWFIRPVNFQKVAEGNFDNRQSAVNSSPMDNLRAIHAMFEEEEG